jgi:hypothetical protein
MSFGLYGYCIMVWGPDEPRSLWDRLLEDTKSRSAEVFTWLDPGDSASLTPAGRASARTSPITAAGEDQSAGAGSVRDVVTMFALRAP